MIDKAKKPTLLLFILLAILIMGTSISTAMAQSSNQSKAKAKVKLLSPKPGDNFTPGQKVKITWQVEILGELDLNWCEQEIFLSLDGGKTMKYRITPELSPRVREYEWTVPNLPTDRAVIDIRFGSEFSKSRFEKSKPQKKSMFRILPSNSVVEEVKLTVSPLGKALPETQIELNWTSSVTNLAYYEVLLSYDQGAHFHSIANTNDESFHWMLPANFSGLVTFKVVAHKLDGTVVASITDAQPIVIARDQQ
ncbi:MAG: hypothetical protein AB1489_42120 [Acidobacteriota bacterium]